MRPGRTTLYWAFTKARLTVAPFGRVSPAVLLFACVALCACRLPGSELPPGGSISIPIAFDPGQYQMIEVEAREVGPDSAEIVLDFGSVQLPPIYLPAPPSVHQTNHSIFEGRLWSPNWPAPSGGSVLRIQNYGPGTIKLGRIGARGGSPPRMFRRITEESRGPLGSWADLEAIMRHPAAGRDVTRLVASGTGETADSEYTDALIGRFAAGEALIRQANLREAFERISGPAPAVRMAEVIKDNVQVRSALLGERDAVIAFSRSNPSRWSWVGRGGVRGGANNGDDRVWTPIPEDRTLPRGFETTDPLMSLAFYVSIEGRMSVGTASLEARLFRLDRPAPVALQYWGDLETGERWLDLKLDQPVGPGTYILELKTLRGKIDWLAFKEPAAKKTNGLFPQPAEALAARLALGEIAYGKPIEVAAFVDGKSTEIARYDGSSDEPAVGKAKYMGYEMVFRTSLEPGETEIYHLRNYVSAGTTGRLIDEPMASGLRMPNWRGWIAGTGEILRSSWDWLLGLGPRGDGGLGSPELGPSGS